MEKGAKRHRVAVVGLGEAGSILAGGLAKSDVADVIGYDVLVNDPELADGIRSRAQALRISLASSMSQLCHTAAVVISAVTADAARRVAVEASQFLRGGQVFFDINSISPEAKRENAKSIESAGADYVEGAVMGPVRPSGIKVEVLTAGPKASQLATLLNAAGMNLEAVSTTVGHASAIKMCRSIMIKGIEALVVECFTTARRYGVEKTIVKSLNESFPGTDWEKRGAYMTGRIVEHGRRRAAEMREAAATVAEVGLRPHMSLAAAQVDDAVADVVARIPELRSGTDQSWDATLDCLIRGWAS